MSLELNDKKIIVDHILDDEFVPVLLKKLEPFIKEIVNKRVYKNEWAKMTGCELMGIPSTELDLKPELELLSRKLCEVFK